MLSFKNFLILFIVVLVGVVLFNIWNFESKPATMEYSFFLNQLEEGQIQSVHFRGGEIRGRDAFDQPFMTFSPDADKLIEKLIKADVTFSASAPASSSSFWSNTFPVLLLMAFFILFTVRQQKGGKGAFGKDKNNFDSIELVGMKKNQIKVTLK